MAHKLCFEALDRTLNDIMRKENKSNSIFGGKIIVFGGDFRQILPVIPKGNISDIVHATINASYLWDQCQILTLTKNMHLLQNGWQKSDARQIQEFSEWIVKLGDGKLFEPNDGIAEIQIPPELLITNFVDPVEAIVASTYSKLIENFRDLNFLQCRAILASRIEIVDQINDYVLSLIPNFYMTYPKIYFI